ncbi:type II toxin-antitoxin system HicA family toxin [Candidatus Bathyarchaeota archaeon]|nr:type II toxin-antitoxin system HicA family toxin [Candidatus Bathyarchaeota archaeon]
MHKIGFQIIRQRGSHIPLCKKPKLVFAQKHDEVRVRTLMRILKDAGLSRDEFIDVID